MVETLVIEEDIYVPKGWGYEHWIVNKKEYCGKILFFKKGKRCSWHYHKLYTIGKVRSNVWMG